MCSLKLIFRGHFDTYREAGTYTTLVGMASSHPSTAPLVLPQDWQWICCDQDHGSPSRLPYQPLSPSRPAAVSSSYPTQRPNPLQSVDIPSSVALSIASMGDAQFSQWMSYCCDKDDCVDPFVGIAQEDNKPTTVVQSSQINTDGSGGAPSTQSLVQMYCCAEGPDCHEPLADSIGCQGHPKTCNAAGCCTNVNTSQDTLTADTNGMRGHGMNHDRCTDAGCMMSGMDWRCTAETCMSKQHRVSHSSAHEFAQPGPYTQRCSSLLVSYSFVQLLAELPLPLPYPAPTSPRTLNPSNISINIDVKSHEHLN